MCRLLGLYGRAEFWQEYVMAFSKLSQIGKIPPDENLPYGHKDGWGMTISDREKAAMLPLFRQMGAAYNSPYYRDAVYSITETPAIYMCHLRKASDNVPISLPNVHPFFHNAWAFIHNGTVYCPESLPRAQTLTLTSDDSDSEHFFHFLLTKIANEGNGKELSQIIADAINHLTVDYTALNGMLSNGRELYVISRYKKWEEYYTMYYHPLAEGLVICSEPIVADHLTPDHWHPLGNNLLVKIHGDPPVMDKIQIS